LFVQKKQQILEHYQYYLKKKSLRQLSKKASVLKVTCTCSHILICFAIWHTVKWISLPVFHDSSPTISIAEAIPEMHISTFVTCKQVRHFDHNPVLQCNIATATIQDCTSMNMIQLTSLVCTLMCQNYQ